MERCSSWSASGLRAGASSNMPGTRPPAAALDRRRGHRRALDTRRGGLRSLRGLRGLRFGGGLLALQRLLEGAELVRLREGDLRIDLPSQARFLRGLVEAPVVGQDLGV